MLPMRKLFTYWVVVMENLDGMRMPLPRFKIAYESSLVFHKAFLHSVVH
jgi:hypothetical protein